MRGVYRVPFEITASGTGGAAKTLIYITAAAGKPLRVTKTRCGQPAATTNQQFDVGWQKVNTLGTPTGTAAVPTVTTPGDGAASFSGKFDITADEPTYTGQILGRVGANGIGGYGEESYRDEIVINAGETWGFQLLAGTYTSVKLVGELSIEEIL